MRAVILWMALFVGVASASEKGQDDTIRTFVPDQETVVVMDHVFELLK